MFKKLYFFFTFFLLTDPAVCLAAPPDNDLRGKLIFMGVNNDSTKSVWLSLTTTAGSFKLEGPGQEVVDEWSKDQRGVRLSISPVVSQGNGGAHHLLNAVNDKKLDSQNQKGGIVFPPFPSWQPGTPTPPIVIPPGSPGTPTHPIVSPPGSLPGGSDSANPGTLPASLNSQSYGEENSNQVVPITSARQLDKEKAWNIWSDNYYFGIRDNRNDVNTKGGATNYTIGIDRYITKKLVAGFNLSSIHLDTTAFDNRLENDVRGYKVGPYLGYQLSQTWAIDSSVNYGEFQNHNKISTLQSRYATKLMNGTLHAMGLYAFGHFQLRPQPLFSYTYFKNPSYDFTGMIRDIPLQITREAEHFALGLTEFKLEANYTDVTKKGDMIQPYTEMGVDYAFVRPSDSQIYSGNLSLASIPKVSGLFTLGLRAVFSKKLLLQASGSYFSIGQKCLDLWDVRLLISYSFF